MNIQNEFMSIMNSGGAIMWVIFIVACGAMIMLIREAIRVASLLKHARRDYLHLQENDKQLIDSDANSSPISQLLTTVNRNELDTKDEVAQALNIQLEDITEKISGSLSTIAVLGSLLPMLGLLGTVTGMINVFEVIALNGSGKPDQMADGISQALLTTASGLIIAIPIIFLHHVLSGRINSVMTITRQAIQLIMHRHINTDSRVSHYGN